MPLYPILAAVWFVLRLAAENGSELIPLGDLVRPLLSAVAACLVLWTFGACGVRGFTRAAPFALVAIVGFSTFGSVATALQATLNPIGGPVGLLVLLVYFLVIVALGIRRWAQVPSPAITRYFNVVAGLLVSYSAVRIAADTSLSEGVARVTPAPSAVTQWEGAQPRPPDIYLILLD
jgi:hypothetical protein